MAQRDNKSKKTTRRDDSTTRRDDSTTRRDNSTTLWHQLDERTSWLHELARWEEDTTTWLCGRTRWTFCPGVDAIGMQWRDLFSYDRCMPVGSSSSCLTFETFSTAVEWIAHSKINISYILHLLNDFVLISPSRQLCQMQLDLFLSLCSYLGIPMAPEKPYGPVTTLCLFPALSWTLYFLKLVYLVIS